MTDFELANVRRELQAAIDALVDEPLGEQAGANRARDRASDHVETALLMLRGSSTADIIGHPLGSVHVNEAT